MKTAGSYDAIVVGAGPAGMMAAGTAGGAGRKVLLIEKNAVAGRKLLISGKGRCNLTNDSLMEEFFGNFNKEAIFLRDAFGSFPNRKLKVFFSARGTALKVERGKRVFPSSDRSKDILNALKSFLAASGVDILLKSEVTAIEKKDRDWRVALDGGSLYECRTVALCTGGLSYPETGSTGYGFRAAERLGHTVIRPRPGLVPVETKRKIPADWQGVTLKNIECRVVSKGRFGARRFGDLLFTHFGLSGPAILDLSGRIYDLLERNEEVSVSIDFKPAVDARELNEEFLRKFKLRKGMVKNLLKDMVPRRMAEGFLRYLEIEGGKRLSQVTREERRLLTSGLKDFRLKIKSTRPIREAIVTRGGVDTREIDPRTMESKIERGLYFAGEIINVDAGTGGYNMQAAFSTGRLCGENLG